MALTNSIFDDNDARQVEVGMAFAGVDDFRQALYVESVGSGRYAHPIYAVVFTTDGE
jgi:hypothetical protein